jgi:uncharacterized linocin/CFP29 family protein
MNDVQISPVTFGSSLLKHGSRPVLNKKNQHARITSPRGLTVNSALLKDEWEELDRRVVQPAQYQLRLINILQRYGLTRRLGGLGTMIAQYNTVSEVTPANISLSGHASGQKDNADYNIEGVPVPVIFKEFELDQRYLESSRRMGDGVDMTNGVAAARVVFEKMEDVVLNGDSSINLNGKTIYGMTNHPGINTDTAGNYGGGDWGTIAHITNTVTGMVNAAKADRFYGPFGLFVATTQYNQAMMSYYDGLDSTPLGRLNSWEDIEFVEELPTLADGEIMLVELSPDVVEVAYVPGYFPITNLEWTSGDGMLNNFKVLSVMTVIVKSDYNGRSGIVLATGA